MLLCGSGSDPGDPAVNAAEVLLHITHESLGTPG